MYTRESQDLCIAIANHGVALALPNNKEPEIKITVKKNARDAAAQQIRNLVRQRQASRAFNVDKYLWQHDRYSDIYTIYDRGHSSHDYIIPKCDKCL